MLIGAHTIIYSKDADADRAFFKDILKLSHVDAGRGWLIFGLPPGEVAVHPGARNGVHEFYLMCDNIQTLVATLKKQGIRCGAVKDAGWGVLAEITLPGGGKLGVYEPRHPQPLAMRRARKPAAGRGRGAR